ncbi:MAG TPA: hypothetical protein PKA00_02695 [Saprospiraceae bacterium]|nr:hypothetical protein [Saprospiraceae bacterium]HMQ81782.1 hypothetical protein [Saprospiraceae bacterium]
MEKIRILLFYWGVASYFALTTGFIATDYKGGAAIGAFEKESEYKDNTKPDSKYQDQTLHPAHFIQAFNAIEESEVETKGQEKGQEQEVSNASASLHLSSKSSILNSSFWLPTVKKYILFHCLKADG